MTRIEEFVEKATEVLNKGNKDQAVLFFTAAAAKYAEKGEMNKADKILQDSIFPLVKQDKYIDIQERVYSFWKGGKDDFVDTNTMEQVFSEADENVPDSNLERPQNNRDVYIDKEAYAAICWCLSQLWTNKGFEKQLKKRYPQAADELIGMRKKGKRIARKKE